MIGANKGVFHVTTIGTDAFAIIKDRNSSWKQGNTGKQLRIRMVTL